MKSELYETKLKFALTERPRRLRKLPLLRALVQETRLSAADFVYPIFVDQRLAKREETSSMPEIYRLAMKDIPAEIEEVKSLEISAVLVFGLPDQKNPMATEAYAWDGVVQQAIRAIKKAAPELIVVADLCLCEYTDHGHCGVVQGGKIDNDQTLELLSKTAVSQAEAGADIVAPSGMMDGQVKAIRTGLDEGGFADTTIMSYAAKYASSFYGPFREAAECAPVWGDRRSYQMDPQNRREALKEIAMDIDQGADIVMVKPALSYLDVIHAARAEFQVPIAAYNVSGEYAMVKAAARNGWLNERSIALEILTGIKRAGADIIITYFAKQASRWLQENK